MSISAIKSGDERLFFDIENRAGLVQQLRRIQTIMEVFLQNYFILFIYTIHILWNQNYCKKSKEEQKNLPLFPVGAESKEKGEEKENTNEFALIFNRNLGNLLLKVSDGFQHSGTVRNILFYELSCYYCDGLTTVLLPIFKKKLEDNQYQVTDEQRNEATMLAICVSNASDDELLKCLVDVINFIGLCSKNVEPEVNKVCFIYFFTLTSI